MTVLGRSLALRAAARRVLVVAVLTSLLGPATTAVARAADGPDLVDSLPDVVHGAHRTGALEGPEGTFPAIDAAIRAGVDVVELDVRRLADGELVVSHDATTTRQAVTRRRVARMTLADWLGLSYDVPAWFGDVADAGPVTFRQVLERYAGKVVLVAEVKKPTPPEVAMDLVDATGARGSVVLQSNDPAVVRTMRNGGFHADLWRSPPQLETDDPATWTDSGAEHLVVRSISTSAQVSRALGAPIPVWVTAVNRRVLADDLLARGVRGLLSDAPAFTFRRTSARRLLPVVHQAASLQLKGGQSGYVEGRVTLPALGTPVPGTRVSVTVTGVVTKGRTGPEGRFRIAIRAPRRVGTYAIGVSSPDLTVTRPGAEIEGWKVRGTSRTDDGRPRLTVVR